MPSPLDLVTAAQLPISVRDAVEAEQLPLLITAASEALASHVGYPVHRRLGEVESVVGHGGAYLFLRAGAVRQVTRVEEAGVEVPASEYKLEVGTSGVSMGRIVRYRGRWPFTGEYSGGVSSTPLHARDTGELLVTFDSGWVTPGQNALDGTLAVDLPAAFQLAAVKLVTTQALRVGRDPDVTSESVGDASIGFGADSIRGGRLAVPMEVKALVKDYRKPVRR